MSRVNTNNVEHGTAPLVLPNNTNSSSQLTTPHKTSTNSKAKRAHLQQQQQKSNESNGGEGSSELDVVVLCESDGLKQGEGNGCELAEISSKHKGKDHNNNGNYQEHFNSNHNNNNNNNNDNNNNEEEVSVVMGANGVLGNEDLCPLVFHARVWVWWDFAALWASICVNPATYMLGSSLLYIGLNWWQAVLAVLVGNLAVLVPLCLNAVAGVKYGIPFPVFARSMFGIRGATILALSRGLIAIAWLGLQLWVGSKALHVAVVKMIPSLRHSPHISWLGIDLVPFLVVVIFLILHAVIINYKVAALKRVQLIAAPLFVVCLFVLFLWGAVTAKGGVAGVLESSHQLAKRNEGSDGIWGFVRGVTATMSTWSAMVLNIADLSRYTTSSRDVFIGQAIGLPIPMTLTCFVGIFSTSAVYRIYGEALWDPAQVLDKFPAVVSVCGCAVLAFSVLIVNVTANLVSPANDFSNAWPAKINFRRGAILSCILALAILPWKLFSNPNGFVTQYLIGYSMITGAIAGVMIADFFIIRKCELDLPELFTPFGVYHFTHGFHISGFIALLSVCITFPGFLNSLQSPQQQQQNQTHTKISESEKFWHGVYDISWVVTFFGSVFLYVLSVWIERKFQSFWRRGSLNRMAVVHSEASLHRLQLDETQKNISKTKSQNRHLYPLIL